MTSNQVGDGAVVDPRAGSHHFIRSSLQLEEKGAVYQVSMVTAPSRVQTGDGFGSSSRGPHVRFRRGQTLVREGSSLVKLRILLSNRQKVQSSIVANLELRHAQPASRHSR